MPKICPKCGAIASDSDTFCHLDGTPLAEHPVTPHQEAAVARSQQMPDPRDRQSYVGRTILGQFRIEEICGTGSMGTVYRATQLEIERQVAVKILHPELANQPEAVLRFHREAKVVSTLSHPNIVHIYLFGHLPDGNLYIIQEFIRGRSLAADMSRGTIGLRRTLHIVDQVLSAIGEAHANGVIHRDLKPENVMLTSVGDDMDFVKILDFGVAKRITTQTFATRDGLIFGSPRYISPEAAQGEKVDPRSDLYSVGVVMYQMLSGEPPFESRKPVQVLMDHINAAPPPLRSRPAAIDVPESVEAIVMKLLGKRPEHRYPTAAAVREALIDAARSAGRPPGPVVPAGASSGPAAQAQSAHSSSPAAGGLQVASASPAVSAVATPGSREAPERPRVPTAQAAVGFDGKPASTTYPGYGEVVDESELDGDRDVTDTEQLYAMQHRKRVLVRVLVAVAVLVLLPALLVGGYFAYRAAAERLFTYDRVAESGEEYEEAGREAREQAGGAAGEREAEEGEPRAKISLDTPTPEVGEEVTLTSEVTGLPGKVPQAWFVIQDVAGGEVRVVAKQVQSIGDGAEGRVFAARHVFDFGGPFRIYLLAGERAVKPALNVEVEEDEDASGAKRRKKKKRRGSTSASSPATWVDEGGGTAVSPPESPEEDEEETIKIIKIAPEAEDDEPPPPPPKKKSSWY
jgi:serine/threonine protein kinase